MSLSFQDLQEALTLDDKDEFIIWQNSSKRNKRVKRGNLFASKGLTVRGKFINAETGDDVGVVAANAQIAAELAEADAEAAQAAANGKNRIFYNSGRPDTAGNVGDYELIDGDLWFDISAEANYAMYTWNDSLVEDNKWELREIADLSIARVNVGKLIAGFISSQVFELANSDAYIQSSTFVETWTNSKSYKTEKEIPSDVVYVKVESSDGTWRIYQCASPHTSAAEPATFPGAGGLWTDVTDSYPTRTLTVGDRTYTLPDCGFRIVGNGTAELNNVKIRGAVVSQIGFFGDTENAVRIDDKGLTVGNDGYLKSRGVGYNGTSFFATSGTSGGFFLGNTQAEGQEELYQLFVGKPTGNNLWWNGQNLLINGSLAAFATGTAGTSGFGLTIGSGFGIRYINNSSVLTITGGLENGVANGAQIDLCGSDAAGQGGYLILQAGSGVNSEIRLNTNLSTDTSGKVGATRLSINNAGLVSIVKSPIVGGSYNIGAGNLYVHSNLGVGRTPEEQDAFGDTDGRIWASEEIVVYNMGASPAIRSVILKKTDGAGMVFLRNGDDSVTITLNGGTGEISASSYNSTSSKRFKKKIKNLKTGLNTINSLRPVTFDWKNKNKQNDIGLIAEEVDKILPMIVSKDERGEASGLDYGRLTTVLIQAVKELSVEVEKLKSKMHYGGARN